MPLNLIPTPIPLNLIPTPIPLNLTPTPIPLNLTPTPSPLNQTPTPSPLNLIPTRRVAAGAEMAVAVEARTGARVTAAATTVAEAATETDHMGTTLLMTQILSSLDNNMTITIPNTPALHNNSSPYSRCIQ